MNDFQDLYVSALLITEMLRVSSVIHWLIDVMNHSAAEGTRNSDIDRSLKLGIDAPRRYSASCWPLQPQRQRDIVKFEQGTKLLNPYENVGPPVTDI
jgi:hypothetical protein